MKRTMRIVLSVAAGVIAAALSVSYASSVRDQAERARTEALAAYGGDLVSVCVATRTIESGETLDESNVQVKKWVASLLPQGAATSMRDVAGRELTARVPKMAVICSAHLEAAGEMLDVPAGKVAVSIPADEQHAVGGAVARGDTVDLYVSKDGISDRLCAARIIDTSLRGRGGGEQAMRWVTVAVEPAAVREVLAAIARGSISLTMPGAASPAAGSSTSESEAS